MFKKKDSSPPKVSAKINKAQANDLALVIARMQKNADQVEKDVLAAEEVLVLDVENKKKGVALQHQRVASDRLAEAEGLLKDLFLDADKAKKFKHPQGSEIESDVSHLHDRWLKDCVLYRDVYDQKNEVELMPRIDWAQVLSQKEKQVNTEAYGPSMDDLKKQIASHNILHKEIEAYNSQLSAQSAGNKEQFAEIQKKYNNLLDNSKWRKHYLSSLYDYMQGCTKEQAYLVEEQNKILKQDWSDRMVDPPDVRRQYENFKNNSLLSHEREVNKLQDDGDRLIELKHPATATIQAQRDDVRNEWQKFLNLCICQETHLDNVEEYKKYQLDVETLSESLTKLSANVDPKALSNKSNSQIQMQLEAEERTLQRNELLLADLRKRSTTITPLKLRRTPPNRPVSVDALCDWNTEKDSISRGDKLALKSNSNSENWDVVTAEGVTLRAPGVCFTIPPPDPDSIDKVDMLGGELADLKKRRAALQASLKSQNKEVGRPVQNVPVSSVPDHPKAIALANQLDQLSGDLDQAQQGILSRMRPPLDRSDPERDLANRLREQERAAETLRALEKQKAAALKDMEPLLSQSSSGSNSALPLKLSAATNKQDDVANLADLYSKKASSSLELERQIRKVDAAVSSFEKRLSEDKAISDKPNAIQAQIQSNQSQRAAAAGALPDFQKLDQNLLTTEQLCSSLEKGYQEYCPDIRRQQSAVKRLKDRYANVNNQLKERESLLQDAANKNQAFQSQSQSLNSFLDSLPNNVVRPNDDLSQVNAKKSSQERVVEDIRRKGDDIDRVVDLSQDLQNALNDYEATCDKFNSVLNSSAPTSAKMSYSPTLADSVQKQEKSLVNRYAEVNAENNQRLNQMSLARNIISQNEDRVNMVVQDSVQMQSQPREVEDVESLKRTLNEEIDRRTHTESDLRVFKSRMMSLKSRRGVERLEEKEVLQYYRDPKLVHDLEEMRTQIHEEALKRSTTHGELEVFNKKIVVLESDIKNTKPKLVTKEVTEIEKDPQLDIEAAKIRTEIQRLKDEVRVKESETIQMKTEVSILQQKPPTLKEKVVKKEVVKLEKDPEMVRAVQTFQLEIAEEDKKSKSLNDEIFQTRSQITALERLILSIQPKVITREVKTVEQDPELIKDSKRIKTSIDEEKIEIEALVRELSVLQSRYNQVDLMKAKVEVKEIVNEIYRVDPGTEVELARLRKEVQECSRQRTNLDNEIRLIQVDLDALRSQPSKVEIKEVMQEVVKEERSPENVRELQRLNDQVSSLQVTYNATQDQVNRLIQERNQWKLEKSKVETKLVPKEVIKYENDPLLEKEADRLRKEVREEAQRRRTMEEMIFDLQNKHILLERQKPEEKVVVQEVVRLQKDPMQIREHDKLGRSLDEAVKTRRQLELEVQQLRTLVEEKENILRQSNERRQKMEVESELQQIKLRIVELENAPPPVEESITIEELLKVERDPKLDRMTNGLRTDMDKESNDIIRIQRDIRNTTIRIELLQQEKSSERTIYKEVIRVEKDQAVEGERNQLTEQVLQERNARLDLEDAIKRLNTKLNRLQSTKSNMSQEETAVVQNKNALMRENENLLRELRTLDSERQDVSISYQQQSRLMSERSHMSRQKSMKMESEIQHLEREILDEKDRLYQRESSLREMVNLLKKEDNSETRLRETNVSTKITILDPKTGKDMSPYEAYLEGIMDRSQYIQMQELECDWEEISSRGPDGDNTVLRDRKSGKQYSIRNALKEGRLTPNDLQRYKDGKMPISEFALLVAGEPKKTTKVSSTTNTVTSMNSMSSMTSMTSKSSTTTLNSAPPASEGSPIAGIIDTSTDTCYSMRGAMSRKLIDPGTAQKLLEAQAATGGIIDIDSGRRYSVHKAAERGLIESSQLQRLLNAQKAYTGVEDPVTKQCMSVGEAVQNGWMPKDSALRYMQAQYLTGGLVDPNTTGRVGIMEAVKGKIIDGAMARDLQGEFNYPKEIVDPISNENINYKQAMARCKKDPATGLLMLPSSTDAAEPSYNSGSYIPHRLSSNYANF